MQAQATEHSRYFASTAKEAADAWKRRVLIIDAIAVVLTLAAFLSYVFAQDPPVHLMVVLFVAYLCIFYSQWVFKTRNTAELMKIVSHDCDPAKLIEVIDLIWAYLRNRAAHQSFSAVYAACSAVAGYDDIALAWVEQVEAENPRNPGVRLSLLSTRAAVAKRRSDSISLRSLRPWVQAIAAEAVRNSELAASAQTLIVSIDRSLAFITGDYATVRSLNDTFASMAALPQAIVSSEYNRAELEAALGDTAAAWPHYSYVAEHGGSLLIRKLAEEWLASHSIGS